MLSLLAPSKTMDSNPINLPVDVSKPVFIREAAEIANEIKNAKDIAGLMNVSASIADSVRAMYEEWGGDATVTKASAFMYKGDVYKGFYADTLTKSDILWMQNHLLILSGLYGVLRPLDVISKYRLEMKAALSVNESKNLYDFWNTKLAAYVDSRSEGVLCILSSEEYAKPIRKHSVSRIVTPVFMDHKPNGAIGAVPIYSKMMRGVMARWIIDNKILTPEDLVGFDRFDYVYDHERSSENVPVFVRDIMKPLVF